MNKDKLIMIFFLQNKYLEVLKTEKEAIALLSYMTFSWRKKQLCVHKNFVDLEKKYNSLLKERIFFGPHLICWIFHIIEILITKRQIAFCEQPTVSV